MMRIRWALSELLYWIGHGFYKLDCAMMFLHPKGLDWEDYAIWERTPCGRLVRYSTERLTQAHIMFAECSITVQGFGAGPWSRDQRIIHRLEQDGKG